MIPPTYQRYSSSGVELEPLVHQVSSSLEQAEAGDAAPKVVPAAAPPSIPRPPPSNGSSSSFTTTPSRFQQIRDLFVSAAFGVFGYYAPKLLKPSMEELQERDIPFQLLSTGDVVLDLSLNYPLVQPPTIPSTPLIVYSIWLPMLLIALIGVTTSSWSSSALNGISSLCIAIGGSEGTTKLLKYYVMRRRPNFYHLCQFNTTTQTCDAPYEYLLESQVSFPSGHSSLSWSGMVVLACFLVFHRAGGKLYRLVCIMLPLSFSTFCACTRIVDHWHHPSDVLTGTFIGIVWGFIGYYVHHYCSILQVLPSAPSAPPSKHASFHE